jgi:hypothetical protein
MKDEHLSELKESKLVGSGFLLGRLALVVFERSRESGRKLENSVG